MRTGTPGAHFVCGGAAGRWPARARHSTPPHRRSRLSADRASCIEPCLPSSADKPPSGSNWVHEIKHDGFRLMARRDPVGIRLITRRGNDWTQRYPRLRIRSINMPLI